MRFARVVETSRRMAATTKRREKIDLLSALLSELNSGEIEIVVSYLSGATPQGRVGIGYSVLRDVNAQSAETATLGVLDVDRALAAIQTIAGSGSARLRLGALHELFVRATEPEQQFLRALLVGELRQGALEGIMLEAVARASRLDVVRVRRAAMVAGDIAHVARVLIEKGESGLAEYNVQLFRPVQPMLAQSAEDVAEALDELGEAALEFKLDGARVQVHRSGDDVVVYSRALNDVTAAVPELVEAARALPVQDIILDGEVIGLQPDQRPYPFQVTMRRFGRKLDVERMRAELPLTPFWFDLLYLNGGHLLDESQANRFSALAALAPSESVIPHTIAKDPVQASEFFEAALRQGHEGIMAKATQAPYAAGARGQSWLKIKKPRTLDLVILAAEWGSGRRRGWLSNLHLGARDTEKGGFAMLGKTFKGLTDEMLAWQTTELLKIEIGRDGHIVFVEPKIVVEIAFNEIQVSPRYVSGMALRFARVKSYRIDKSAAEADTFETVRKMAFAVEI
jgi:DNA ligase-1